MERIMFPLLNGFKDQTRESIRSCLNRQSLVGALERAGASENDRSERFVEAFDSLLPLKLRIDPENRGQFEQQPLGGAHLGTLIKHRSRQSGFVGDQSVNAAADHP